MGADRGGGEYQTDLVPPGRVAPARPRRRSESFRRAARALAAAAAEAAEAEGGAGGPEAQAAARELIALARAGERDALADLLRADPGGPAPAWTVACYQIGDLTPTAWRDFADPVEAVVTLAGCGEAGHLAAELLVSTEAGLRWTALVRTGERVVLQPLTESTASESAPEGPAGLAAAAARWATGVAGWEVAVDEEPDGEGAVPVGPTATIDPALAVRAISEELTNRLDVLVDTVGRAAADRADKHDREIDAHLADLEARLGRIEVELRRLADDRDPPPPAGPTDAEPSTAIDLRDGVAPAVPRPAVLAPMIRAGTRQALARAARAVRHARVVVAEISVGDDRADVRRGDPARSGGPGDGWTSVLARRRIPAAAAQETVDGRPRRI